MSNFGCLSQNKKKQNKVEIKISEHVGWPVSRSFKTIFIDVFIRIYKTKAGGLALFAL